ncbi:Kdo domain containing protein [Flavobacterium sp. HJJ]|uniref:Kdo domain containing protein n=1 Tax=Flavobacterium sp. HJJ TaxID=2783792 RepID=UPI00188B57D6|nr:Kdo domain containing protein [Flavobacterium sp. HJJ]MBF4472480.1 Kdo domain containing protein [Flavobacterium sp. HJJ]
MKNFKINPIFENYTSLIIKDISRFNMSGTLFGDGKRNIIKLFELDEKTVNIKSFKIPNLINKVAYKYFRKSKARRSFEYATFLLEKGIGTPEPIAYLENYNWIGLKDSYYASEHLQCDLTYRELVQIPDYPDHENILRQFTRFSYDLHQKGIEFIDHSSGNTLIKKRSDGNYDFFLVDLNRMKFHQSMSFEMRMFNLRRLTPKPEMIAIMSNEYAKFIEESESLIYEKMLHYTKEFQIGIVKKQHLKKTLKFWKKY